MSYNFEQVSKIFFANYQLINFETQLKYLFESVVHSGTSVIQHSKASRDGKGTVFANNIMPGEERFFNHKIAIKSDSNLDYLMKVAKKERYVISNATYYGGKQNIERLSGIYYLFLDFDHVSPKQINVYLELANKGLLPLANIVELSGKGLHLYFKLENPINRCFERQKLMLSLVRSIGRKIAHAMKIADPNNQNFKYDELNLVHNHTFAGVVTKDKKNLVTGFMTNFKPFTTKELNNYSEVLTEEQEKYCDYDSLAIESYRKKIEIEKLNKTNKQNIKLRPEIFLKYLYLLLKHEPRNNSYEGQRYKVLSNFIALGKKCYVSNNELKKYVRKIVSHFNKFDSNNPFTHSDIHNAWSRGTSIKVYQNQINRLMGKKMPFWTDGIISQKDFEKNILNSADFHETINGSKITNKKFVKKYDKKEILATVISSLKDKKNKKGTYLINKTVTYKTVKTTIKQDPLVKNMRFNKSIVEDLLKTVFNDSPKRLPNFVKNEYGIYKTIAVDIFKYPTLLSKAIYRKKGFNVHSYKFNNAWKQAKELSFSLIESLYNIAFDGINYELLYSSPEFLYYKNNIEETFNSLLKYNNDSKEKTFSDVMSLEYKLYAVFEKSYNNKGKQIFIHQETIKKNFNINIVESVEYFLLNNRRRTNSLIEFERKKNKELNQKIKEIVQDKKVLLNYNINYLLNDKDFKNNINYEYCGELYNNRFSSIPKTKYWRKLFQETFKFIKNEIATHFFENKRFNL